MFILFLYMLCNRASGRVMHMLFLSIIAAGIELQRRLLRYLFALFYTAGEYISMQRLHSHCHDASVNVMVLKLHLRTAGSQI